MTHKPWLNILIVVGLLALPLALGQGPAAQAAPEAAILYVQPGATGMSCSTWGAMTACELQTALGLATSGDEVWVAQGVYKPTIMTNPSDARIATFQLKTGVALYGGFDPDSGVDTFEERDWTENATVLSGDIDGNDNSDPTGVVTDTVNIHGENAYHVVTGDGVGMTAILDGFTITAGNSADWSGGGMYNDYSSPTLTNVTFSGNLAKFGGGMYNWFSTPTLAAITFISNTAVTSGGGIFNEGSSPTLTGVTFSGNSAVYGGGGMDNNGGSNPTLTGVTFSSNSAGSGGGISNEESSPRLADVTFSGNSADWGGGMYNGLYSGPALTNVTFSGNSADWGGGGMYNEYSSPTLTNVTFTGNTAVTSGGGMYNNWVSSPMLTNTILWGNTAPDGAQIHNTDSDRNPVVTYSDIQDGYIGTGNIDADPYFVNATGGNLRLKPGSPAIDAGDNEAVPLRVVTDLDGKPRFVDIPGVPDTGNGDPPIVDMGAYEAQNLIFLPVVKR